MQNTSAGHRLLPIQVAGKATWRVAAHPGAASSRLDCPHPGSALARKPV